MSRQVLQRLIRFGWRPVCQKFRDFGGHQVNRLWEFLRNLSEFNLSLVLAAFLILMLHIVITRPAITRLCLLLQVVYSRAMTSAKSVELKGSVGNFKNLFEKSNLQFNSKCCANPLLFLDDPSK